MLRGRVDRMGIRDVPPLFLLLFFFSSVIVVVVAIICAATVTLTGANVHVNREVLGRVTEWGDSVLIEWVDGACRRGGLTGWDGRRG